MKINLILRDWKIIMNIPKKRLTIASNLSVEKAEYSFAKSVIKQPCIVQSGAAAKPKIIAAVEK